MKPEENLALRALGLSVASVWIGVYLNDFLFCVFGGVFLGIALTVATVLKAMRDKS